MYKMVYGIWFATCHGPWYGPHLVANCALISCWVKNLRKPTKTWGWVKTLVPFVHPKIAGKWIS